MNNSFALPNGSYVTLTSNNQIALPDASFIAQTGQNQAQFNAFMFFLLAP